MESSSINSETPLTSSGGKSRTKLVQTFWLFWAIMLVGFDNGLLGPTVMSLLKLSGSPMSRMQVVFIGQGSGFVLGIGLTALLTKRIRLPVIMAMSLFLASLVNAILPWMRVFSVLIATITIQGFFKGVVDYAALALCGVIWPRENDVQFQFVSTGVALAAFLAPFLAYPALHDHSFATANNGGASNSSDCRQVDNAPAKNGSFADLFPVSCMSASTMENIYIPYLIIAIVMLPAGVAFLYYSVRKNVDTGSTYEALSEPLFEPETITSDSQPSKAVHRLILGLLLIFYIPFAGIFITYSHLLTAFGVKGNLHIDAATMAIMTSVYWGCFLLGRLLNTLFSTYLSQFVLLVLNFIGFFVANIVLLTVADTSEPALWIGTALLSLFNAVFLPGVMTWVGASVSLEGSTISVSLIGVGIGELTIPFVTGYLFNVFGPMALMYVVFTLSTVELLIFVALCVIKYRYL